VLAPTTGEVFLTITNLQWITAPTIILLLTDLYAQKQISKVQVSIKSVILLINSLTGPFAVIFSPLAIFYILRNWKNLNKFEFYFPTLLFCTAISIQLFVYIHADHPTIVLTHELKMNSSFTFFQAWSFLLY
jgi:hypothetical protein